MTVRAGVRFARATAPRTTSALLALALVAGCAATAPGASPLPGRASIAAAPAFATVRPMAAQAFVDTIGVNTHLLGTLTGVTPAQQRIVIERVRQLGIRHVRDQIFPRLTAGGYAIYRTFFAATHTDMLALTDCPKPLGYYPGSQTPPQVIRNFDREIGGAIDALEGPNEPNLRGVAQWASLTRRCIGHLDAHQALPVPFVAPSLGQDGTATFDDGFKLGNLRGLADIGNIHRYVNGRNPGTGGYWRRTRCGWYGSIAWYQCAAARPAGLTAPVWMTETGYTTAGPVGSSSGLVDATTQGKYVSRVLFVDSLAGIARTYLYDLRDDCPDASNPECGYGLIQYDGTPKPAFNAVRAIVGLLADPGPAFAPVPLRLRIAAPPTVDRELFQKRNGADVLALWDEVPSWNPNTAQPIAVQPVQVTVSFARAPHDLRFRALDDAGELTPAPYSLSRASVTVPVDDHVAFLTFAP